MLSSTDRSGTDASDDQVAAGNGADDAVGDNGATAAPFEGLEREIRLLIRRAQSSGTSIARRVHPELDASAYPLLAHISERPGARGSDLATFFGVGRATVSRQLSRLVELGLVERTVDPEDSRGQRITLTPDGAARLDRARSSRVAMLEGALATWETEEVAQLARLLNRYSADIVAWKQSGR
ncbi:MarR family winged helix-turn-helix transcriptional regulator [Promicromonospora iranensis]|jgi:DNA-binding MarR family transcriptional regulator|uniref:MarR family winged helix-turn-helix transcriptional regulator n=1 Tax=Promicromonospora iranensis TaxID=1105144 RepID=UPI0023A9D69D|nr:MarR family winged helix-turn-helix transcriptional regulator [Promicromonospora iranensis]